MTIRLRYLFAALLLVPAAVLSVHAQQVAPLQQRMGADEFKAAGLDKLTPQELTRLEQWLASHNKPAVKMVDASGEPVFYASDKKRETVRAHLVGSFDGWHGSDQVTLDNGQQWRQVGTDKPMCMRAEKPAVKVRPSLMGNWLMHVDGCNDSVHVRRVK